MKVAIILGSVRKGRQSHKLAYYLNRQLIERNIETDLIDLAENILPIYGANTEQSFENAGTIDNVSQRLAEADALIFVSPEYHGSFSGVLKNALDFFWEEFKKKPIGVATVSAGRMGGINASSQLQQLILSLGGYPLPVKLLVSEVQNAFDSSGRPAKDSIVRSANQLLDELIWLAEAVEMKKRVESTVLN